MLITGLPGVGKTTVIRKIAEGLRAYRPAGFYTEEIRVGGNRTGFRLITLDRRSQILSHVEQRGPHRVGRYGVDVPGFERLLAALDLPHTSSRVIILDEIGKMECCSNRFCAEVERLLASPRLVIATIALKGTGFIEQVKRRPDSRLVTVTHANRDRLAETLSGEALDILAAGA